MSIPTPYRDALKTEQRWAPDMILRVAWQRKGLVMLGLLIGILAAAGIHSKLPRVYQSSAQVSIVKKRPDSVTGIDTRYLTSEETVSSPQDLLRSSMVIERAIQSKGLGNLSLAADEATDLTDTIKQALTVVPGRGPAGQTFVYKLNFRTGDAEDSQVVLKAVLDSFKELMDKKHQAISEDTIEMILREKTALEKEMAEKEAAYRAFREKTPLSAKGADGRDPRQERLNSIQTKRSALLLQRIELEGQLSALDRARKEGRSQETILAMLAEFTRKTEAAEPGRERQLTPQELLFPLLLEERKLIQLHGAKHPEVLEIRNRIEAARRLLLLPATAWKGANEEPKANVPPTAQDPIELHVQMLKQKLDHTKISEELLANVFHAEQDEARRLAAYEVENDSLQTSVTLNQRLYEALVRRLNEVSLVRNVGGYQIEVLEAPALGKKVAPSLALTLVVGMFAGLGLGLGLASWADHRDLRFRSTNEIAQSLGMNVMAVAPRAKSEAFWKLRNTLCQLAEKSDSNVIQIAEPLGGEGAHGVAANLSKALAQAGKKVLRIDATAKAWNLDGIAREDGLVNVAAAITDASDSQRLRDLLTDARSRFDFILVETPAVLLNAEATALPTAIDSALLTIDFTTTTRPQAERAAQLLASAGVNVLGVVVHGADAS